MRDAKLGKVVLKNSQPMKQVAMMFAIDFALYRRKRHLQEWAERYNVSHATIVRWLNKKAVIEKIKECTDNFQDALRELAIHSGEIGINGLINIVQDTNADTETRRKAAYNLLGFAQQIDVNKTGNVNVIQQQAQKAGMERLSDEQLDNELKKLESM